MSVLHARVQNHPVRLAAEAARVSPTLTVQRGKGWAKVHEEGRCRMCGRAAEVRPLTRHHLVPEHYFRRHEKVKPLRHCDANIVPLCRPCHDLVDAPQPERAAYRAELRRCLGAAEVAFVIQVRGPEWLGEAYPRSPSLQRRASSAPSMPSRSAR